MNERIYNKWNITNIVVDAERAKSPLATMIENRKTNKAKAVASEAISNIKQRFKQTYKDSE